MTDTPQHLAKRLAELTLRLEAMQSLESLAVALDRGELRRDSGPVVVSDIAAGRAGVSDQIRKLLTLWQAQPEGLDGHELALMLRGAAAGARAQKAKTAETEVVWTGPDVTGTYLRATRQVVQDIIHHAQSDLLVVGYWVAGRDDGEGIINDIVDMIAQAVQRGVAVTMVLDQKAREQGWDEGKTNRDILASMWPTHVPMPDLLTWQIPDNEKHLKLHAKVLVADHQDALVTSANLTMHALDKNMEMGVRVVGTPADQIVRHFDLLRQRDELVPFA